MALRLKVPPTKSVLLKLKRETHYLQQGYNLLERKRELLTRLVYDRLANYRTLRRQVRELLNNAYRCLAITHIKMGNRMLYQISLGLEVALDIKITPRSRLGVEYPSVSVERCPTQPHRLLWSDASLDETREQMIALVAALAQLGEAETALRRMLAEQHRIQKRVNALKYNVIPRYQTTIRFIESALEEEERSTLFQIKVLRESR